MMLVVATISFIFAQENSSSLLKRRDKEIIKVVKQNLPPEEISAQIKVINDFYQPLIDAAMTRERGNTQTQSQNQNTQNTNRRTIGANVDLPGFQGGSCNIVRSAVAFSIVSNANTRQMFVEKQLNNSENGTIKVDGNFSEYGYEGLLINEYSYQNSTFIIIPDYPMADSIKYKIAAGQKEKIYLLPGRYFYRIVTPGYKDAFGTFSVLPDITHNVYGEKYFFFVSGGRKGY